MYTQILAHSGIAHITPDRYNTLRQRVNKLMSLCISLGRSTINVKDFKAKTLGEVGIDNQDNIDADKLLEIFDSLSLEVQTKIILDCTDEDTVKSFGITDIEDCQIDYIHNYKPERTAKELNKLIKYCKNPLEKKKLQRELSIANSFNGKHRKGKKH